jgi:excisionase family DNA binding protein
MGVEATGLGESTGPPIAASRGMAATLADLLVDPAKIGQLSDGELNQILVQISALLAMVSARIGRAIANRQPGVWEETAEYLQQLTVSKVAALLDMPKARVYELIRRGQMPAVRVGVKNVRVSRVALREWIARHQGPEEPTRTVHSRSTARDDWLKSKAPATPSAHSASPGGTPRYRRQHRRALGAGPRANSAANGLADLVSSEGRADGAT